MNSLEPVTVSLDKELIARLKTEAVRGKPYAERISIALAFRLLNSSNPRFDPFSVLDEIDYLEGIRSSSRTKKESQFRKPPLYPFWHKHFFSAQHLLKNIGIRWNLGGDGNKDLDNLLREVAEQHGDDPDAWPNHLTHQLVIGGFTERSERGLTGDWLIYAKCEGQNYYLDLATHEEGLQDEADSLFNKLKNGSKAEFPFLFQEET
ncbi:hypothetical protein [Stutzerimonas nitrititolerans]|uniref:hypothetical protein n=1 Tax=Stutzerimonas nitrititolerans TaxID=2482751 RepID=UPI0028A0B1A9|nr:hypothetical protein [Stutzerimonas nitrititolerans]